MIGIIDAVFTFTLFAIDFVVVDVVDNLPFKFTNDLTVKSITAVKAERAFDPWMSCIAKSMATSMNMSSTFRSINDVGLIDEVCVTQVLEETIPDKAAHIRGEANGWMDGNESVHTCDAPHPHWDVDSRTASFIYEVKVTHSYVWEECCILSLCAGCLITEVANDVVRDGNW